MYVSTSVDSPHIFPYKIPDTFRLDSIYKSTINSQMLPQADSLLG